PGATVEVKNPDGDVVGTGTVGDDGKFDVTVPKDGAKPGDPLSVTQTEPGKDPSDTTTVTVTTPEQTKSETPTGVTATGQEDGSTEVTGTGTPGATVEVKNPAGDVVGTGTVGDDGKFDVTVPKDDAKPGDPLSVTQTEPGKDPSDTTTVTVTTPEQTKSETPTGVTATGQEDGSTEVTGTGTPGATVEVKNPAGDVVGTGTVGDDGKFNVTVPKDDAKPGVPLSVTQTEPGKDPSDTMTVTVTTPEQTKSETPTGVTATGQEDGSTEVTGTGTPGATVEVKNPDGKVVGTGTVGDDGKFDITVPKDDAKPGDDLTVTETEDGKQPSDPATATVTTPEQTKSETPTGVTATGQEDGSTEVTGTGTPGATVEVKNPAGEVVGTGTVGDDGKFDVTVPKDDAKPGDPLSVTQTEPGKNPSDTTTVTVTTPERTKSETPTGVTATGQEDGSTEVTGTGTPGATVEVKTPGGEVVGTGTVGDDGQFEVKIPEGTVKPGDGLSVTETEPGKDPSSQVIVKVPDAVTGGETTPMNDKSKTPSGVEIVTTDDGGTYVKGSGTPGATVEVKTPGGEVVGTGTVGDDGQFEVKIPEGTVKPGDGLSVTQTEPGKDPSSQVIVKVPDAVTGGETTPTNDKSKTPSGVEIVTTDDGGTYVKGSGTPGATVEVKTPGGEVVGTGTVGDDGQFEVKIPEGTVKPGDGLSVTETEPGKDPSSQVIVKVPDAVTGGETTPTNDKSKTPGGIEIGSTVDGGVYIKGSGTPGATVEIKTPGGSVIGEGIVGDDGQFEIHIPGGVVNPGDNLTVFETENGKQPSDGATIKMPNTSVTPGNVTSTVDEGGNVHIEGNGVPGATVQVKDPNGNVVGEGVVDGNGEFDVTVPADTVKPGTTLGITETEPGKLSSSMTAVKVPDTIASVRNSLPATDAEGTVATNLGNPAGTTAQPGQVTQPATGVTTTPVNAGTTTGTTDGARATLPATDAATSRASLPSTGEENGVAITAFGGALILGLIGLAGDRRKRKN
ncbi:Ig-like domain-containing protein, partial [Lacticaseibacillus sp. GG6-2]